MGILSGREFFMHSSRSPRGGTPGHAVGGRSLDSAALPALLRASHLLRPPPPPAPPREASPYTPLFRPLLGRREAALLVMLSEAVRLTRRRFPPSCAPRTFSASLSARPSVATCPRTKASYGRRRWSVRDNARLNSHCVPTTTPNFHCSPTPELTLRSRAHDRTVDRRAVSPALPKRCRASRPPPLRRGTSVAVA